jgi:hypothetical protein
VKRLFSVRRKKLDKERPKFVLNSESDNLVFSNDYNEFNKQAVLMIDTNYSGES